MVLIFVRVRRAQALRNNDAQQTSRKNIANPARTTVPDIPDCSKQVRAGSPAETRHLRLLQSTLLAALQAEAAGCMHDI
jgi:hypothetical protein